MRARRPGRQHQKWQSRHWMIDVLWCGDPIVKVTQTVTLSKLNGMMGAHNGLDEDTPGWSYIPVCVC